MDHEAILAMDQTTSRAGNRNGTAETKAVTVTVFLTACNYESTTSPVTRNIERGYKESYIGFPGKGFHNPGHWESLYQVS